MWDWTEEEIRWLQNNGHLDAVNNLTFVEALIKLNNLLIQKRRAQKIDKII